MPTGPKNKRKILIHNLTFRGIEVVPGVLDFDQRGVIFASPGDILITKTPIEKEYLNYLDNLGWNFKDITFLNPKVNKKFKHNSVFYDNPIISSLKKLDHFYLDTYNATFEEHLFAKKIKKLFYGHSLLSEKYGTKSGFRKLAKKLGLKIALGYENITDLKSLNEAVESLFSKGIPEIAIKIDEGISGAGTTKLKLSDYKAKSKPEQSKILKTALFKIKQAQAESGAAVEEWLQDIIASPSIQVEVFADGTHKIVSSHDQLLDGDEKWYIGCKHPQESLTQQEFKQVLKDIDKFAYFLSSKGFVGFFGIDLVINKNREIYFIEANMRKPGTFYPRIVAEKINSGSLKDIFYLACDFTVPYLKGLPFTYLKDIFNDFLYPVRKEKRGIILYNTGALKEAGRFDIICVGKDPLEPYKIYERVKGRIQKINGRKSSSNIPKKRKQLQ